MDKYLKDIVIPGMYINKEAPIPSFEKYRGMPLTEAVLRQAQDDVDALRLQAECSKEYIDGYHTNIGLVRAYYGGAGEAIKAAEEIKDQVNANLLQSAYFHLYRYRII